MKGEGVINLKKVVTLPTVLEANTIYFHRDAAGGLMVTITDMQGLVSHTTPSGLEIINTLRNYTDSEIAKVATQLGRSFETTMIANAVNWGDPIYSLQIMGTVWRIKKVDGTGLVTYSYSTDTANDLLTEEEAWTSRSTLIYT